jgi:hypothetical protein
MNAVYDTLNGWITVGWIIGKTSIYHRLPSNPTIIFKHSSSTIQWHKVWFQQLARIQLFNKFRASRQATKFMIVNQSIMDSIWKGLIMFICLQNVTFVTLCSYLCLRFPNRFFHTFFQHMAYSAILNSPLYYCALFAQYV